MKKKFDLNIGTLQASGLYNITPKDELDNRVSLWFDRDEYLRLKKLKAVDFNKECEAKLIEDDPITAYSWWDETLTESQRWELKKKHYPEVFVIKMNHIEDIFQKEYFPPTYPAKDESKQDVENEQIKVWAEVIGIVQRDHGLIPFMETAKELLKTYGPIAHSLLKNKK